MNTRRIPKNILFSTLLLALAFLINITSPTRAEDAARFLLATNFLGTFTHTLNVSGQHQYPNSFDDSCSATWSFAHVVTATCDLKVDPETLAYPTFRWFASSENKSASVNVNDTFVETCTDSEGDSTSHSYTVHDVGVVQPGFSLLIDTSNNNYVLFLSPAGIPIEEEFKLTGGFDASWTEDGSVPWAVGQAYSNTLPSAGLVLQGQATFPMDQYYFYFTRASADFFNGDPRFSGTGPLNPALLQGSVTVTWSLTAQREEPEVIVEPRGYDTWMPRGSLLGLPIRGNSISVSASLQKKGGGPTQFAAESFKFRLSNVSKMPGVCMNYPVRNPDDHNDLKFESELNPPRQGTINTINEEQTEIEIGSIGEEGLREAGANVSSFDFGAYGELQVLAYVPGFPQPIVGHLKEDTGSIIRIPKTRPGSHISVAWEGIRDVDQVFDDEDQDSAPQGDGHPGDGISLYEEYRGFSENRTHIRTSPTKKDLFIRDRIHTSAVTASILDFKQQSRLEVHNRLDRDEINDDAVINFNQDWAHNLDQHGLILVGRSKKKGFSIANPRKDALVNSTPGSKGVLEIEPRGSGSGWDFTQEGEGDVLEYTEFFTESAAHEIAHGCSVWHHGDCDIDGEDAGLRWVVGPDGGNLEVRHIGSAFPQTPITILNPDGSAAILRFLVNADTGIRYQARSWLAVPQGQHSGDAFCTMCYNVADCFRRDMTEKRFLNGNWPPVVRTHFCTSAAGTGVNASAPGGPWLGNAYQDDSVQRGNCAGQICVNDLYVHDLKHDRNYICPLW